MRKRWVWIGASALALIALVTWAIWPASANYRSFDERITADDVTLDTRLYLPKNGDGKFPAIMLAHGFGGTKMSVSADAIELAGQGYAVLTWTARGFGQSTGQIHLNSREHEVKDAQRLLDWLAQRDDIQTDKAGDPRVGVMGGSYGGALALMLAGQDDRVDAIVPMITWNDLSESLFPGGVFKQQWAGIFFSGGLFSADLLGRSARGGNDDDDDQDGSVSADRESAPVIPVSGGPECGRWAEDVCEIYLRVAASGVLDDEAREFMQTRSPSLTLNQIKAPSLLIQGEADSLFPLSEADANAKGITNAPVRVAWFTGGHDGGSGPLSDQNRVKFLSLQWLDHYVKGTGDAPSTSFTYSRIAGLDAVERGRLAAGYSLDTYPGLSGSESVTVNVAGPPQSIANPPNGTPAAISALPQAGSLSAFLDGVAADLPGQHGNWISEPLTETLNVVGEPTVRIRAASPTGEATLFVKLYDMDQNFQSTLSNGLVAPIRLTGLPATLDQAQPVTVRLPGIVRSVEEGHRIRITIASADQAYLGPAEPAVYQVMAESAVTLPTVAVVPIANADALWLYVLIGLAALLLIGVLIAVILGRRRHVRREKTIVDGYQDVPLHVRGLGKTYGDFVAVESIDFTVQRGQVVGLLGPNGAGKTTSLRVLMGLTQATKGEVLIFGHELAPGTPVLSRIGALVEGPGFLPHLSGRQNLLAYWTATGRPFADARFEESLEIAGLGDAIDRRVKDYSHGMKQRLAVAQAMLGLPELLVLDEPTDGLDPPQIAEMRRVLQRYATDGRAVLVSSHLLAEVEQTCTHVVVMHKGRVVASGTVEEIVGDTPTTIFDVSDVDLAQKALDKMEVSYATDNAGSLVVELGELSRAEAVAALVRAGVGIDRVTPRRRLEDAFLALVGTSTAGSGDR
jgi:ABC-2 type transport system ATP-binding protein